MTCGHEPDSAAAPPPPQQVVAETVMGQISDILAAGDGDDASSQAFAAKELFNFLVSTSEKLAEAESKLLKYGEEEAVREQVRRR